MINIVRDLESKTREAIEAAIEADQFQKIYVPAVKVTRAARPELGDYATPVAMQLAKLAKRKPDEIAALLARSFPSTDYVETVSAVGGFLNFRLSTAWLQAQLQVIIDLDKDYGFSRDFDGKKAQVECVSANPTGPITVGRIRGGIVGDTLARLLRAVGYSVELEYYYNDAGAQIDKLADSVRARYLEQIGKPSKFPEGGYQGEYIVDIAKALAKKEGDELASIEDYAAFREFAIEKIQDGQRQSLKRVGIVFDTYFSEQSLYEDGSIDRVMAKLKELDLVYEALGPEQDEDFDRPLDQEDRDATKSGPAVWLRMRRLRSAKKDCALVRSNGEPTYRLPDIAYHVGKLERGFDLAINVLGADHIEEAKDVKAAVRGLGLDSERIHAIIHQFITLTEGGATKRMSTRKGDFVTLDELVSDVGPDAVRYFILARSVDSHMDFDLDLARKQSSENPVYYIQNAHVRCVSILNTAKERNTNLPPADLTLLVDERELNLIRKLIELPEIIQKAVDELAPHRIAFWAHEELARALHTTYEDIRALHESVSPELASARLKLYDAARVVLRQTLSLMGVSAPDEM